MTVLTINAYKDATERIYRAYGIAPEQLGFICQSIALAHLNSRADHEKRPNVHYNVWEAAKNDILDYIDKVQEMSKKPVVTAAERNSYSGILDFGGINV